MPATNTTHFADLTLEYGWNPAEADLLGASPYLNGDTPISFARFTLDQFANAFAMGQDGKPKFCADRNGRVVPCDSPERVPGGRSGETSGPIIGTPPFTPDDGWIPEEIYVDKDGNSVPPGTPGAQKSTIFSKASGLKEAIGVTGDDLLKRGALLLLAIVLIAIAVISFR